MNDVEPSMLSSGPGSQQGDDQDSQPQETDKTTKQRSGVVSVFLFIMNQSYVGALIIMMVRKHFM